jgi:hypothetical protein
MHAEATYRTKARPGVEANYIKHNDIPPGMSMCETLKGAVSFLSIEDRDL